MDLSQQQEEKENAKETFKGEAAIPEAVAAPLRSSPRLINSAGEHIMSKTGRRAAQRNLELNEGDVSGDALDKNMGKSLQG
jgi:hypothetical protein